MFRAIDDHEKDYPNLVKHAGGYPTPNYLRSITKVGNIKKAMEWLSTAIAFRTPL